MKTSESIRKLLLRKLRKRIRSKAQQAHPDKDGGSSEAFQKLQFAYEILSDVERRKEYDTHGTTTFEKRSLRDRATNEIATLLIQTIQTLDIEHADLIGAMKHSVNQKLQEMFQAKSALTKVVERNDKIIKRIKSKTADNFLAAMLNAHSNEQKRAAADVLDATNLFIQMLEILEDYKYQVDIETVITNPFANMIFRTF